MTTETLLPTQGKIESAKSKRDRRARNKSVSVKSSIPAGATSTPGSMVPEQSKAARITPENIDYVATVREIMAMPGKLGNGYGDRVVTKKGQNWVFSMACKTIKSKLGMEKLDKDGQPIRLADKYANRVKDAIRAVLDSQYDRFRTYGGPNIEDQDIRWTWDQPYHKVVSAEDSGLTDKAGNKLADLQGGWKATAVARRASKDVGEEILWAHRVLKAATSRLENMDKNPSKYDAKQKRDCMDLIHLANWKINQLEAKKALLARKTAALAVLDGDLANGKVTAEQYKAAKAQIDAATE